MCHLVSINLTDSCKLLPVEVEDWALCSLGGVGQLSLRAWISDEGDDVYAFFGGQKDGSGGTDPLGVSWSC